MQDFLHNDFVIGFPDRWIDTSVVALAGPPDRGFSPSITITRERLDFRLSVAEYAANQLAALQQELGEFDYAVVEEGLFRTNDLQGYQRIHTFTVGDSGVQAMQLQIYLVKGEEGITITCTSTTNGFNQHKPLFMEALRQFKWKR